MSAPHLSELIALVDAYGAAVADETRTSHATARAYRVLARSQLIAALRALLTQPAAGVDPNGPLAQARQLTRKAHGRVTPYRLGRVIGELRLDVACPYAAQSPAAVYFSAGLNDGARAATANTTGTGQ